MTNKRAITTSHLEKYQHLTLREIESITENLRDQDTPDSKFDYRVARQALANRQRELKMQVMDFESINNHHLLFYDSTSGFAKMAGRSVLFFSMTLADRLHWRYSIKPDTDHYFVSEDGVISFRSLEHLSELLISIGIIYDQSLSTSELHFYKLPKVYSDEQIASLRDHNTRELKYINEIIMPISPVPALYEAICEVASIIYYQFKHLSDPFTRDTIGVELVRKSFLLVNEYLSYANSNKKHHVEHILSIIRLSRELRNSMAYVSQFHILHHRETHKILNQLLTTERISTRLYYKARK